MRAVIPTRSKPSALESFALAKFKSTATRTPVEEIAKTMGSRDDVLELVSRADQTVGTTGTSGWASQLVQTAYADFLSSLAPGSAAARVFAMGLQVPFREGKETFRAPYRNSMPAALPWVGEGQPIPVREFGFDNLAMTPKKMASISVLSRELARKGGEAAVRTLLREDAELSLDAGFFSDAAGDTETHAGILNGITIGTGYGGGDLAAFEHDVGAILEVIGPRNSGSIAYVVSTYTAERLVLRFPDFKSPVFASQAVSDTRLIGIDAGSLATSFGGFDVDASIDAVVHMSDEPLEIVSDNPTTADPVRSLFQTDAIALRIIGEACWGARKANIVHAIDGVTW